MKKNFFRLLVLAISPLLLSACSPGGCNAFQTLPARISVLDDNGHFLTGYTVSYKLIDDASAEKICEAASECVLDGLYGARSSVTVSKNGFESVTVHPKEFIYTENPSGCTSQSTVAITLKALS